MNWHPLHAELDGCELAAHEHDEWQELDGRWKMWMRRMTGRRSRLLLCESLPKQYSAPLSPVPLVRKISFETISIRMVSRTHLGG